MKSYYNEVCDLFREKSRRAWLESESKKAFLREKISEIAAIDIALSQTGMKIFSASTAGGDIGEKIAKIREENELLHEKRRALLRANGYPEDYSDIKYECEKCSDTGFVGINMCSCMKSAISHARLEDSDMGELAKTQSFDNFSFKYYKGAELESIKFNYNALKTTAESFCTDTYANFLLIGATGLGKTHLSTSMGVAVIDRGFDVVYKSVQSMFEDFEAVQFRGGDELLTRRYFDCDLLIIDDLGVELSNQFTVSCLYNVINARINNRRSTVINTNLSQAELRDKYADRITSRLFGEYRPLCFTGTDVRRQKLKEIN